MFQLDFSHAVSTVLIIFHWLAASTDAQVVFTDTDLTISSGDYDIEYSNSVLLTTPEIADAEGYSVYNFWYCPTDGNIYGAGHKLKPDGTLTAKTGNKTINWENSCNDAQIDADYYWDDSSEQIYIMVAFSCKIGVKYQILYATTLKATLDAYAQSQIAYYDYADTTAYVNDATSMKVSYLGAISSNDHYFGLTWNAYDSGLTSSYSAYSPCGSSSSSTCTAFDIFLGTYSLTDNYWSSNAWSQINVEYPEYYALYPTTISFDAALELVEGQYIGYNIICWNWLQYLNTQSNTLFFMCASNKLGEIRETIQLNSAAYEVTADGVTLWNRNGASTPGLSVDIAYVVNRDVTIAYFAVVYETGSHVVAQVIKTESVIAELTSFISETPLYYSDTGDDTYQYNPVVTTVPTSGVDSGKYIVAAWVDSAGYIYANIYDYKLNKYVSTDIEVYSFDYSKYFAKFLNIKFYEGSTGIDSNLSDDYVIITWTMDFIPDTNNIGEIIGITLKLSDYLDYNPTSSPTNNPTAKPTNNPSNQPSLQPSMQPTGPTQSPISASITTTATSNNNNGQDTETTSGTDASTVTTTSTPNRADTTVAGTDDSGNGSGSDVKTTETKDTKATTIATTEVDTSFPFEIEMTVSIDFSQFNGLLDPSDFMDSDNEYQNDLIDAIDEELSTKLDSNGGNGNGNGGPSQSQSKTGYNKQYEITITSVTEEEGDGVAVGINISVSSNGLKDLIIEFFALDSFWNSVATTLSNTWDDSGSGSNSDGSAITLTASVVSTVSTYSTSSVDTSDGSDDKINKKNNDSGILSNSYVLYAIIGVGILLFLNLLGFIYYARKKSSRAKFEMNGNNNDNNKQEHIMSDSNSNAVLSTTSSGDTLPSHVNLQRKTIDDDLIYGSGPTRSTPMTQGNVGNVAIGIGNGIGNGQQQTRGAVQVANAHAIELAVNLSNNQNMQSVSGNVVSNNINYNSNNSHQGGIGGGNVNYNNKGRIGEASNVNLPLPSANTFALLPDLPSQTSVDSEGQNEGRSVQVEGANRTKTGF